MVFYFRIASLAFRFDDVAQRADEGESLLPLRPGDVDLNPRLDHVRGEDGEPEGDAAEAAAQHRRHRTCALTR